MSKQFCQTQLKCSLFHMQEHICSCTYFFVNKTVTSYSIRAPLHDLQFNCTCPLGLPQCSREQVYNATWMCNVFWCVCVYFYHTRNCSAEHYCDQSSGHWEQSDVSSIAACVTPFHYPIDLSAAAIQKSKLASYQEFSLLQVGPSVEADWSAQPGYTNCSTNIKLPVTMTDQSFCSDKQVSHKVILSLFWLT